jgi:hypothetical protein
VIREEGKIKEGLERRNRRKPKCVNLRVEKMELIMGQDVVMEQVFMYQATTLVGKFNGHSILEKSMSIWIKRVWRKQ